jgi:hypothetical protein
VSRSHHSSSSPAALQCCGTLSTLSTARCQGPKSVKMKKVSHEAFLIFNNCQRRCVSLSRRCVCLLSASHHSSFSPAALQCCGTLPTLSTDRCQMLRSQECQDEKGEDCLIFNNLAKSPKAVSTSSLVVFTSRPAMRRHLVTNLNCQVPESQCQKCQRIVQKACLIFNNCQRWCRCVSLSSASHHSSSSPAAAQCCGTLSTPSTATPYPRASHPSTARSRSPPSALPNATSSATSPAKPPSASPGTREAPHRVSRPLPALTARLWVTHTKWDRDQSMRRDTARRLVVKSW